MQKLIENPGESTAKETKYSYGNPTTVYANPKPIRIYQNPDDYYYKMYHYALFCSPMLTLEERVLTTSSPQNVMYSNKNNHVGYGWARESWEDIGAIDHFFSTPENIVETFKLGNNGNWFNSYKFNELRYGVLPVYTCKEFNSTDELPPALRVPEGKRYMTWLMGAELRTQAFNNDGTDRRDIKNNFEITPTLGGSLLYTKTQMYQNNHPGAFWKNYWYRKIRQFAPFARYSQGTELNNLINFLVQLILQTIPPHPYKRIERNYFIADRRVPTNNFRLASSTVTNTYGTTGGSQIITNYEYPPPNPLNPAVPTSITTLTNGDTDYKTEYLFAFDTNEPEIQHSDQSAINYLQGIGYTPS